MLGDFYDNYTPRIKTFLFFRYDFFSIFIDYFGNLKVVPIPTHLLLQTSLVVGMNGGHRVNQDVALKNIMKRERKKENVEFKTYKAEENPEGTAAVVNGNNFQQEGGPKS